MKLTAEQAAITGYVSGGKGNLIVDALAGSGKTSTVLVAVEVMPHPSALLCAFNKRIADELEGKIKRVHGRPVAVKTFHGQGLAVLKAHHPRVQVNKAATEDIVNRVAGGDVPFKVRRAAVNTLRTIKETYAGPDIGLAYVKQVGLDYRHFKSLKDNDEIQLCAEVVQDGYAISLDFSQRSTIDFCDMVWAPVALGMAPRSRFKAIFVDELQDISEPQLALLRMLMPADGRLIGIGDQRQQIYAWRGSMGAAAWQVCQHELKAKRLPLTMTWRCSKRIVREAQALVPELRAREDAPEGSVEACRWGELPAFVNRGIRGESTFILSRNNAHLLDCALFLWRERVRFELNAGKELLDPMFTVLDTKLDQRSPATFRESLAKWERVELARAEAANATAYADHIEEQASMLRVAAEYAAPNRIKGLLFDMMQPNNSGVLLSTVHKVKGLEAERVFMLKQTFGRHAQRSCKFCKGSGCNPCNGTGIYDPPPSQEELNIEYVGITRAIRDLVWVDLASNSKVAPPTYDRAMRDMLGVKTEREQILDAGERFPAGISRAVGEAMLDARGEVAQSITDCLEFEDAIEDKDDDDDAR